jgi:predicted transcriptional regulator YheO
LHEIDAGGILREANLEENERSMENGREIGILAKKAKKTDMKGTLMDAISRDEEFSGKRKTYKEYADELGISERTVMRYLGEIRREYGDGI